MFFKMLVEMANLGPDVAHIFDPRSCEAEAEAGRSLRSSLVSVMSSRELGLCSYTPVGGENGVEMQRQTDRQMGGESPNSKIGSWNFVSLSFVFYVL